MKNRLFRGLLVGAVSVCTLLIGSLTAMAAEFPDVSSGSWYYPYVQDVSEKGLMSGYSDGRFGPHDKLTRGQFATVLWRMSGSPDRGYSSFPDVPASSFYAKASEWARSEGVITGYSDGRFGGNDDINREQVATILYRYSGGEAKGNIWEFPDAGSVSTFAKEGMSYAVGNGIISGDNGKLNPHGTVVRAVAATMISRYSDTQTANPDEEETKVIHHEAVYEKKWVVDKAAWTEYKEHAEEGEYQTVTIKPAWDEAVYETHLNTICSYCGAIVGGNAAQHSEDHAFNDGVAAGWHEDWVRTQVDTIHHPAVTEKQWVVTKQAWTEAISHAEEGHFENVKVKDAWDEVVKL